MRLFPPALLFALSLALHAEEYDVVVYGATPAGIAAALAAADDGERVLLVEPARRIGGLVTNGLTHTDFRTFEGLTGAYFGFSQLVEAHYRETYGADSPQVRQSLRGTQAEPKVNLLVLEKLLASRPRISVRRERTLQNVKCSSDADGDAPGRMRAVEIALFADAKGAHESVAGRFFIDATYEGDLMAAAGVPYRVGREAGAEYGEALAPDHADRQLQGYNFRFCMTGDPANRVLPEAPKDYRREEFTGVLPLLESGKITAIYGTKASTIYKAQTPALPNGKFDINDVSGGLVRLSLPGENDEWPDGRAGLAARIVGNGAVAPFSRTGLRESRASVFDEHLRWNVGLLYFLQNDEAVPAKFREEARTMGWCRDEFADNGHLPEQLYVREARRMVGQQVFTQRDTAHAPGDARAVLHRDAIAMGDYGPNCHGTAHLGSRFGGKHSGEFYQKAPPYQIPYGVLLPKDFENLLVPVAASSSHVGFCALRLEPIWMSLGQAAGHAVHLARVEKKTVSEISIPRLQARLHQAGAASIYVSDIAPGDPDFALVQWWGTAGGFHGLAPAPATPGERGKNIIGQYYEAFPGHAAELGKPLDAATAERWRKLATELGLPGEKLPPPDGKLQRGEWLRAAGALRRDEPGRPDITR